MVLHQRTSWGFTTDTDESQAATRGVYYYERAG